MNVFNAVRRTVVCLVALGLVMSIAPVASGAPMRSALQTPGGVRGANGQPLRVTVKLGEKPLVHVKIAIKITAADGTVVVAAGTAFKNAVYSTPLDAGTYTVTVTTAHYTGSSSVTIVHSISPALLTIHLEKQTAAASAATTTTTTHQ